MSSYIALETRLEQAIKFILDAAHKRDPYPQLFVLHSVRVGLYLQEHGFTEEVVLAGFLHDVLEDTPVTLDELQALYGQQVADIVQANTHNMQLPRLERSRESLERCVQLGTDAVLVKAVDTHDNLRAYLSTADPALMDWLRDDLRHLLDVSQPLLGDLPVWRDIREQYEALLNP